MVEKGGKITEYLKSKMNKHAEKETIASQDEILEFLTGVMRAEIKEETLIGMGDGLQQVIETSPSIKDQIKAAELLGKRYVMWTDKVENTNRNIEIEIGAWDDEDDS